MPDTPTPQWVTNATNALTDFAIEAAKNPEYDHRTTRHHVVAIIAEHAEPLIQQASVYRRAALLMLEQAAGQFAFDGAVFDELARLEGVGRHKDAGPQALPIIASHAPDVEALTQQRDDLLAICDELVNTARPLASYAGANASIERVRELESKLAAIAAAEPAKGSKT